MPIQIHHIIQTASGYCFALVLGLVLASAHADDAVPPIVKQELARQGLPVDALSYQVEPLHGSLAPGYAQGAHRAVNPASAMKLVTTLAALHILGPAYRWTTTMSSEAMPEQGVLRGNLYLQGDGDPNLTWERIGAMLRTLRNGGTVAIAGDLVLDRSLFQPARLDIGAPPFDDTPDASYNVIPDALTVSDYLLTYTLSSDGAGLAVHTTPPLAGVRVVNGLALDDRPCSAWEDGWRQPSVQRDQDGSGVRIVLAGAFPRHCKATVELHTLDRDLYVERLVRALWQEMGGQWNGRVREGKAPAGAVKLAERQFETLGETIRAVNKSSHAVKARMLYLTLGSISTAATDSDSGQPTHERARRRVLAWIAAQGIDPVGIVIENGAGLSRHERLSPASLSALLRYAAASRWYPEFAASLPIAALDGTLKNRMKGSAAAGNARLKTGTLRDVAALAGYVRDLRGQDWIVTAFVNHPEADPQAGKGRAVLDQLVNWVAAGEAAPVAQGQIP